MKELKTLTLGDEKFDSFPDQTARESIENIHTDTIRYTAQTLTEEQKSRARENIGAANANDFIRVTTKEFFISNATAFTAWNGSSILSSADDSVSFTRNATGNGGVRAVISQIPQDVLFIELSANFDSSLFNVNLNIFDGNSAYVGATPVSVGKKTYTVKNLSSVLKTPTFLIIISTNFKTAELVGEPVTISAVRVWHETEKYGLALDEDEVIGIVEGAKLTSNPYYTTPTGENYLLQVGRDGGMVMVPVVPSKALFIGNSLLIGFGFGMAASDREHDYYYLINQAIAAQKGGYTASKMSGTNWEAATTTKDQEAFLTNVLSPNLSDDLELVIVQLGDNVNTEAKLAVFAEGSRRLLEFIRTSCSKARVVWVGAWYQTAAKQKQMAAACKNTGCTFIDIWDLATSENKSAVGNSYTDTDGNVQTITSDGVASHPGDAGFKAIANRVLYELGIVDTDSYYA